MKTYKFNYNIQHVNNLRDTINKRLKVSLEKEHSDKETKGKYFAWDRICAIMDRLEDTMLYVNDMELGKCTGYRSAFDFYDFINCSYVIIECIKTMGKIFEIDNTFIENIEKANDVFGTNYGELGYDQRFFEYVRSLCVVHPLCTNHQKEYLKSSSFHCCPFVWWNTDHFTHAGFDKGDLTAIIYDSQKGTRSIRIPLYIEHFEAYLNKWVELIPKVIEAKETYAEAKYEEYKAKKVKHLKDFKNVPEYLSYLKAEYKLRFDLGNDYIFDEYIRTFQIKLSNPDNQPKLEKYKTAIVYSLQFLRNALQNMSFDGPENTGIHYPSRYLWNDLFTELNHINTRGGSFATYSYNLSKLYDLAPNRCHCDPIDKEIARSLIGELKLLINKYVSFTSNEPDEEQIVLVNLALYLEALDHYSGLNPNIPNEAAYRDKLLTQAEWDRMLDYFNNETNPIEEPSEASLEELLKLYGQ